MVSSCRVRGLWLKRIYTYWLGRIKPRATAGAGYFLKDRLEARVAAAPMAELLTEVLLTRQETPAHPRTDVLIFNIFGGSICSAPVRLPLRCRFLATAAMGVALMPSTVQCGSACSEAHWLLNIFRWDLLTSRLGDCPATLAGNFHLLETRRTFLSVTGFLTEMATGHLDTTGLRAMGDFVLA